MISSDISARDGSAPLIRSDALAQLREIANALPSLASIFGKIPVVHVVVDANVVLADLMILAQPRRKSGVRTILQELEASGTVCLFAPTKLREELERHLPTIARQRGFDLAQLRGLWADYEAILRYFEPDPAVLTEAERVGDPDDLPYAHLRSQLGARAVYSRDQDLRQMGAPVVQLEVFLSLRDYTRAASIELTIKFGLSVAVFAGVGAISAALAATRAFAKLLLRLPTGAQVAVGSGVALLLIYPKTRAHIMSAVRTTPAFLRQAGTALAPILLEMARQHAVATAALGRADALLPTQSRRPALRVRVRAVCVASRRPLTSAEIARHVREEGYLPRSQNPSAYLRRMLRTDDRFLEIERDRWTVRREVRSATN
jgi:predicted nucleic acid-binding protein